jgi:hypothetical protein
MPLSLKKIAYIILAKVLWGASYANSRRISRISARLARLFSNARGTFPVIGADP